MDRREALHEQMAALRREADAIDEAEAGKKNKALVGQHFKFKNSYGGCTEAEKWWMYLKVLAVENRYTARCFAFQVDSRGEYRIEPKNVHMPGSFTDRGSWLPITAKEYNAAWKSVQKRIAKYVP